MRRRLPCFIVTAFLGATAGALAQSPPGPVAQPPSPAAGDARASAYANPVVYAEQKAQWMARLQNFPGNVEVIEGAAQFFILHERGLSQQLFEEGRTLEPSFAHAANLQKLLDLGLATEGQTPLA